MTFLEALRNARTVKYTVSLTLTNDLRYFLLFTIIQYYSLIFGIFATSNVA